MYVHSLTKLKKIERQNMSFTINVTQLIEKRISTKVVNGLWNMEDTATDCDDGESDFENLFTDLDRKHSKKYENKISNSSALKTDIGQRIGKTLTKMKVNKGSKGMNEPSLKNEDHDDNTNIHLTVREKNEDEIDFFDSDDEYLETHGFRFDEYNVFDGFPETTAFRGGRYSEGIDRFKNLPVYRRSIQKFAKANDFEIYDLIPDGNCMFQALSDQFMINGRLGYTAESLRETSIQYLRNHPYKDDGHHMQSFLCQETWIDYLKRMSRTKEWGDHIVLQALVDAFNLHITIFNVFEDDVRHTVLQPEAGKERKQLQVFLGHVGKFHYLSLRPCNWTELWPYKSLMYRTIACLHHISLSAKLEMVGKKIAEMKACHLLSEEEFTDMITLQHHYRHELYFETYALNEKELQETQEAPEYSLFDPLHIDVLTGIPLPHLSYLIKQLLPETMILCKFFLPSRPLKFSNLSAYFVGIGIARVDVELKDISRSQKKANYYRSCKNRNHKYKAAVIARDKIVQHHQYHQEDLQLTSHLLADTSKTKAGYCNVRVLSNEADKDEPCVVKRGNEKYLRRIKVSDRIFLPPNVIIQYEGLPCDRFPPEAQDWINRKRKFSFPSRRLYQTILQMGCTLIKKPHQNSRDPDIEWKYDFSLVDQTIFETGLSKDQQYGFWVFKILIENVSSHLKKKLKLKHLIAVYYRALEEIPSELWETNFSGCILFVVSSMVACLKDRYLPHYFIPSFNLLACYSANEINALRVNVECIRMFPLSALQITAENHGYTFAEKLIKMVFRNCKSYQHNTNWMTVFTNAFIPGTLGVMRALTRLGFYDTAFRQLLNLHEQMLLVTMPSDRSPAFFELFETALRSCRQKSTRTILALLFNEYLNTDILFQVIDESSTFAKDILPWKLSFEIEWMEIPSEKVSEFSTLAEYFYSCGIREYKKRNKTLASATLETAITCLRRYIQRDIICPNNTEDKKLTKEVLAQNEEILLKFRRQLMSYYIDIWNVSKLDWNVDPLMRHIGDIEKLCLELPEMTDILIKMFRYLHMEDKALDCEKKNQI